MLILFFASKVDNGFVLITLGKRTKKVVDRLTNMKFIKWTTITLIGTCATIAASAVARGDNVQTGRYFSLT